MLLLALRSRGGPAGCAAIAFGTLLAGYLDLWRGGTDWAAALLTVGYVLLIPCAILVAGGVFGHHRPDVDAPPYRPASVLSVAVLALYAITLAPSTAMWDASEYIAAAKVLGIPHPPGNPMFVLLAHAFALLPVPVSYAARVNLLAATTSAVSAGCWFLVAHRSLRGFDMPPIPRRATAAAAAWLGATAFTVWNQSVVNEKVYTVAMLGLAVSAWCALRWHDALDDDRARFSRADAYLVLAAYVCGLGYANHPAGFLPIPAIGLFVLRRPSTLRRWRTLMAAALLLGVGLTPFLSQPIRAAHRPAINVGEPTACAGAPELSCTFSTATWQKLMSNVSREQYGGHNVVLRQAPIGAQFGMWWQYFQWQWMRDVLKEHPLAQQVVALCVLALGLFGGVRHYQRDRASFALVAPLIFTLTPALIVYLNFRYGATQSPELGETVNREVRDRDYFYVWSFATWSVWVGIGLGALWQQLASRATWARTAVVMALALVPLLMNGASASRRGQHFTALWARDLLQSVEPNGVLITNGDNDSFPVWYAQLVEGVRPDVTIALVPYLNSGWYARQLLRLPQVPYDDSGIPAFRALNRTTPATSFGVLTAAETDAIPPYLQLQTSARFQHDGIDAEIPIGYLTRDQLMVLQFIKSTFPARPIHFSIGGYARGIGLNDFVVTQGLTQRLLNEPAAAHPEYLAYPGGYLDLVRTRALWQSYRAPLALLSQGEWVDEPSVSIPAAYVFTGRLLGFGTRARGDSIGGERVLQQVDRLARAAGLQR